MAASCSVNKVVDNKMVSSESPELTAVFLIARNEC